MSQLYKRGTSGLVYVVLFLGAILFSEVSYIVLISFFGITAIWEYSKLIQTSNLIPYILFPLSVYFFISNSSQLIFLGLLLFTLLNSLRLLVHLYDKGVVYPTTFFSKLDVTFRYLILPFSFLIVLPFHKGEYSPAIIISVLTLIWTNDTFAYLVGRNFGKRKLFVSVSPNKTKEGFFGGVAFSVIAGIVLHYVVGMYSFTDWILIALIVSVLGSIGDLIESKFKRQANQKDSGTIMPGHGGILDRLDSLIFVVPFVYLYINFIS